MSLQSLPALAGFQPIDGYSDQVTSNSPGQKLVTHTINFSLPVNDNPVNSSEYLVLNFNNYKSISIPNGITGSFGDPVFGITGKSVTITNISILPGTQIQIMGITATNPSYGQDPSVILSVSNGPPNLANPLGQNIQCLATTDPNATGALITVSANILSTLSGVNVSGYTSPYAFVTMTENGTSIGTTAANQQGDFQISVNGLVPGNHSFLISSTDQLNRPTSQASLDLYLPSSSVLMASGIILSPSISLDKASINPGDTLTISGAAVPSSTVNIFTESPLRTYTTTSDITGNWSYTLPSTETRNYLPGEYRAYTNVQDGVGDQSITSPTLNFTVLTPPDNNNPLPACNISHGDLNCDGKVNLTDFSILLYYWHTNQHRADINNDGIVNLTDFSIMMYYFQH
jgi:hypothetical protein